MTTLENLIWSFLSKAGASVDGKPIAVDPFADHSYRPEAKMEFNGSPVVIGSAP